jgi:hypothetical protein
MSHHNPKKFKRFNVRAGPQTTETGRRGGKENASYRR